MHSCDTNMVMCGGYHIIVSRQQLCLIRNDGAGVDDALDFMTSVATSSSAQESQRIASEYVLLLPSVFSHVHLRINCYATRSLLLDTSDWLNFAFFFHNRSLFSATSFTSTGKSLWDDDDGDFMSFSSSKNIAKTVPSQKRPSDIQRGAAVTGDPLDDLFSDPFTEGNSPKVTKGPSNKTNTPSLCAADDPLDKLFAASPLTPSRTGAYHDAIEENKPKAPASSKQNQLETLESLFGAAEEMNKSLTGQTLPQQAYFDPLQTLFGDEKRKGSHAGEGAGEGQRTKETTSSTQPQSLRKPQLGAAEASSPSLSAAEDDSVDDLFSGLADTTTSSTKSTKRTPSPSKPEKDKKEKALTNTEAKRESNSGRDDLDSLFDAFVPPSGRGASGKKVRIIFSRFGPMSSENVF